MIGGLRFSYCLECPKAAYEEYSAEVTKLGQLYSELAKETFKPFEGFALHK
jgi:hypothetical protein